MKIKDLPPETNLGGQKVLTHTGEVGYWKSQWGHPNGKAGVWLGVDPVKGGKIVPIFLDKLEESLEWEITDLPVNI